MDQLELGVVASPVEEHRLDLSDRGEAGHPAERPVLAAEESGRHLEVVFIAAARAAVRAPILLLALAFTIVGRAAARTLLEPALWAASAQCAPQGHQHLPCGGVGERKGEWRRGGSSANAPVR